MKKITYICGCTCEYERKDLKLTRLNLKTKNGTRQLRCPIHFKNDNSRVENRKTVCDDCGAVIVFCGMGGRIPVRCKACQKEYRKEQNRANNYSKSEESKKNYGQKLKLRNGKLADPERWDCAHRRDCLTLWDRYDAVPCKGCKKYKSESLIIDGIAGAYRHGEVRANQVRIPAFKIIV